MRRFSIAVLFYCLPFIAVNVYGQRKFYVKGQIDSINDGAIVALFRYHDGSMDAASIDTIRKGKFLLSDTASHPTLYWVSGSHDDFPGYSLQIWAAPGLTIQVSGRGYRLKTWNAESSLHEQDEENQYLAPSIADWNQVQEIQIRQRRIRQEMQRSAGNKKDSLGRSQTLLRHQADSIMVNIYQVQIRSLQKLPVTEIWLNKMFDLSFYLMLDPHLPYRESILQLYKRMTDKQRASIIGKKITGNLFPPTAVKIGDAMADMPLLDTQLVTHKLAEYTGGRKYLLLDFGFTYCGSCMDAIPETTVLHDSLINILTIIGINVDETAFWKAKVKEKRIPWINLNDSRARSGIAGCYGVKGYPCYVIISPDGIVLGEWTGYEKGELTRNVMRYLTSRYRTTFTTGSDD